MARKQSNKWQADVKDKNSRRVRPTFAHRWEAEAWEDAARTAARQGLDLPPATGFGAERESTALTWGRLAEEVYNNVWRHQKTPEDSWQCASRVVQMLGEDTAVSSLTYSQVLAMRDKLLERGLAKSRVNRYLAALSRMLSFARQKGAIKAAPKIDRFREPSHRIRWITEEEEQQILDWMAEKGQTDIRDLVEVLIDTGMRKGEALDLAWEDVDLDRRKIHIWRNKADFPRTVPMTARVGRVLERRKAGFAGFRDGPFSSMVGTTVNHVWRRMRVDMGLDHDTDFIPHALRHTTATRLLRRGVNPARVQKILGHKTLAMTMRYAHVADEDLEEAMSTLETV